MSSCIDKNETADFEREKSICIKNSKEKTIGTVAVATTVQKNETFAIYVHCTVSLCLRNFISTEC